MEKILHPKHCNVHVSKITTSMISTILKYLQDNVYTEKFSAPQKNREHLLEEVIDLLREIEVDIKVEFIIEQLQLLLCHPNGRRFTPSMQAMTVMWQNVSPGCYKQILEDGVLTLPSVRHLRRLTSSLNVELELTE